MSRPDIQRYEVTSRLEVNGKRFEPGAEVWLSLDEAEPLIGGAIRALKPLTATDLIAKRVEALRKVAA